MNKDYKSNDPQTILTQAIDQMKMELGDKFDPEKINLAELERRTGISRSRLRRYKKDGFIIKPHGRTGLKAEVTVLTGYTGFLDDLLRKNVTNASVCFERLREHGYTGGQTQVRVYIRKHQDLVPPKRALVDPQGNRGRRYRTGPAESYQMDWGFVEACRMDGSSYRCACFAMICHHCGERYVEFFPNAKQENLFIGMIHAFYLMGIPKYVLTDNMKSVVISRDQEGHPVWQHDYEAFMNTTGFKTKLCKPYHPFTKGKVERLIQFVKGNFTAGRRFFNATDLNAQALEWCARQSGRYRRAVDCVPADEHAAKCLPAASELERTEELAMYLCPRRRISFDGFVSYEGRRFGVPYWYPGKTCRVSRDGELIHVYSDDLSRELAAHPVTWSRKDSFCEDQYADVQPVELPTAPVTTVIAQLEPPKGKPGFDKFDFEGRL